MAGLAAEFWMDYQHNPKCELSDSLLMKIDVQCAGANGWLWSQAAA